MPSKQFDFGAGHPAAMLAARQGIYDPMQRSAEVTAAAYQAIGQSLGRGAEVGIAGLKEKNLKEKKKKLYETLQKDENFVTHPVVAAQGMFPEEWERAQSDPEGARQSVSLKIQRDLHVSESEAAAMVVKLFESKDYRILRPEGAAVINEAMAELFAEGETPEGVAAFLDLNDRGAYGTMTEADEAAHKYAMEIMQPSTVGGREAAAISSAADQANIQLQGDIGMSRDAAGAGFRADAATVASDRDVVRLAMEHERRKEMGEIGHGYALDSIARQGIVTGGLQRRAAERGVRESEVDFERAKELQGLRTDAQARAADLQQKFQERMQVLAGDQRLDQIDLQEESAWNRMLLELEAKGGSILSGMNEGDQETYRLMLAAATSETEPMPDVPATMLSAVQSDDKILEQLRAAGWSTVQKPELANIRFSLGEDGEVDISFADLPDPVSHDEAEKAVREVYKRLHGGALKQAVVLGQNLGPTELGSGKLSSILDFLRRGEDPGNAWPLMTIRAQQAARGLLDTTAPAGKGNTGPARNDFGLIPIER